MTANGVAQDQDTVDNRPVSAQPCWAELVEKIRRNESDGLEELYRVFSKGVRFYLCRQLGPQDLDDRVHDTFIIVAQAIQRGELREPDRLMGYVRTIVRRQVAAQIEENVINRRQQFDLDWGLAVHDGGSNPEQAAIRQENQQIAVKVLKSIAPRDREILIRFYLWEQPADQICSEMGLTDTQFRLLKSRAKARFGQLGKRKVTKRLVPFRENNSRE
ncbi:MAG TPA: sigma-70 family RNA polymerase sigma factor [Bryobacteraceae bacterium]|jgi:RNA polymerase sigma factor (sigma-70 family)|nr:sigma-70 family RNA polymerase sigma factor [Bryobacteraceae bacterium]